MAKFVITERRPAFMFWEYIVEAQTEEEALAKVQDYDCSDHWSEESSEDPLITIKEQQN